MDCLGMKTASKGFNIIIDDQQSLRQKFLNNHHDHVQVVLLLPKGSMALPRLIKTIQTNALLCSIQATLWSSKRFSILFIHSWIKFKR